MSVDAPSDLEGGIENGSDGAPRGSAGASIKIYLEVVGFESGV
jgi:hypothetical protein